MRDQNNNPVKVHMVSHVHWDPMWYSSFQEYRIRLYSLFKKLIKIYQKNPDYKYFMFDGQVGAIEDYLELVPEDEDKIREFVSSGRLSIGPWYVQPEEFLISGESLIRNLKLGIETAEKYGGSMKVSYLCDPVGHIAQLPQIVGGFGIKYFSASRGVYDNEEIKSTEFFWIAPDGSKLLAHTLPLGYSNKLPLEQEDFNNEIARYKERLLPSSLTGIILYAQGCDHGEPMDEILGLAKAYNEMAGNDEMVLTTLEEHMKLMDGFSEILPCYTGELRFSHSNFILSGILTTRMSIKLINAKVENRLEKWLEPFSAVSWLVGNDYPHAFIDLAWKYQINNSFHDCIYGAHADHVTADIINNYKQAQEITEWKTNDALYSLAGHAAGHMQGNRLVIYNPTIRERSREVIDCEIFMAGGPAAGKLVVRDINGNILPSQINSIKSSVKFSGSNGNVMSECMGRNGYEYNLSILVHSIPAFGLTTLFISREAASVYETDLEVSGTVCENSFLKVDINNNGTIDVLDKAMGQKYEGLHYFEDSGDYGDQYNYSPTIPAGLVTSEICQVCVALENAGPVKAEYKIVLELELPAGLDRGTAARSAGSVVNRITISLAMRAYSPTVEFHTIVENNSRDHRLNVVFPTKIVTGHVFSGSQFFINKREIELPEAADWVEPPSPFRPHRKFVCLGQGIRNFTFMDTGLTEHKVNSKGEASMTLLRSVSHLSKNTLPERMYKHAGPPMETPLAQEQGKHHFDYALYFQQEEFEPVNSLEKSEEFESRVKCVFIEGEDDFKNLRCALAAPISFFSMQGGKGIILSAVKKGKHENIIIRLFNSKDAPADTRLIAFLPMEDACMVDLGENFIQGIETNGNELELHFEPYKIITLSIKFKR